MRCCWKSEKYLIEMTECFRPSTTDVWVYYTKKNTLLNISISLLSSSPLRHLVDMQNGQSSFLSHRFSSTQSSNRCRTPNWVVAANLPCFWFGVCCFRTGVYADKVWTPLLRVIHNPIQYRWCQPCCFKNHMRPTDYSEGFFCVILVLNKEQKWRRVLPLLPLNERFCCLFTHNYMFMSGLGNLLSSSTVLEMCVCCVHVQERKQSVSESFQISYL